MNYFERRRYLKSIKHLLHDARHAYHMRSDIAAPDDLARLKESEQALKDAWSQGAYDQLDACAEQLSACAQAVYPPKPHPKRREYLEILVVAVTVAMAFRTFFIQPFKIPTGSMEPTLFGIKETPMEERTLMDRFPLSVVNFMIFGEKYVEVKAARSGRVDQLIRQESMVFSPEGLVPPHRDGLHYHIQEGAYVIPGQLVASGRVRSGDHIFVNKVRYNFTRPKRGDIFVFSTDDIAHPDVKDDTFYIKRLVGMPSETLSIDPPYLVADGERVLSPDVFDRQAYDRASGYFGYVLPQHAGNRQPPPVFRTRTDTFTLGSDEYMALGDNTLQSLDGRYFGGVKQRNVVGPAFAIYWPISDRWGFVQ